MDKLLLALDSAPQPSYAFQTILLIFILVSIVIIKKFGVIEKLKRHCDSYDYTVSDMEELNELYTKGEITKEEYDKRKKAIIDNL